MAVGHKGRLEWTEVCMPQPLNGPAHSRSYEKISRHVGYDLHTWQKEKKKRKDFSNEFSNFPDVEAINLANYILNLLLWRTRTA